MRHLQLLDQEKAVLLIVDMQESFRSAIPEFGNITRNISTLIEASKILELPVVVTEQYPQGLGKTVKEISACLGAHKLFDKQVFSCCQLGDFMTWLHEQGRSQVIVAGIECHVCVSQTAHDLLASNYLPHIIADAVASRSPKNKEIALDKMRNSGAVISSLETALFELLIESGSESFKAIQRLVR